MVRDGIPDSGVTETFLSHFFFFTINAQRAMKKKQSLKGGHSPSWSLHPPFQDFTM